MTTVHCKRCWSTLNMYEIDLLQVWSVWGASIITSITLQVKNRLNLLLPPLCETKHISGWGYILAWPLATVKGTETLHKCIWDCETKHKSGWVAFLWPLAAVEGTETLNICVWRRPIMSMMWVGCLNHILEKPRESPTTIPPPWLTVTVRPNMLDQAGVPFLWPVAAVKGTETLYMYMKKTCYEYEVGGCEKPRVTPTAATETVSQT
jgi:hypothetical protein